MHMYMYMHVRVHVRACIHVPLEEGDVVLLEEVVSQW